MKNVLLKNFRQMLKQKWLLKMTESVYQEVIKKLITAKIASPRLEARLLIAAAAGVDADTVNNETRLAQSATAVLKQMIEERLNHKPLDKIIGHKAFYKYDFIVNENVLSPRPDTEILVEAAANLIKNNNFTSVLDLGVGSGCVLLSLLKDFPHLYGTGVDKSNAALDVARQNQVALEIPQERIQFVSADWFDDNIVNLIGAPFDMVVSNPPYIPSSDIELLDIEVKDFDPQSALDGGHDGMDSYRRIAAICQKLLANDGFFLAECGIFQAADIIKIFTNNGLAHHQTITDLSGIERCIIFRKKDCN